MSSEKSALPESAAAAFWRGAVRPSWPAAILTVAVCSVALWAATTFVTEDFFLRHRDLFRIAAADPALDVTVRSLQLAADLDATTLVAIVGDRDDFPDGVLDKLVAHLREHGDGETVADLTTPGQTLWESAALADRLPMTCRGVVLLAAFPSRFRIESGTLATLLRHPALGLRSRAFDVEVQRAGLTASALFDNFFLDHQTFLLHRAIYLPRNLVFGPKARTGSSEDRPASPTVDPSEQQAHREVLRRIVERLKRKTRLECLLLASATDLDEDHRRFLRGLVSSRVDLLELDDDPVRQLIPRLHFNNTSGGARRSAEEAGR